jgi:hypothetical protein
MRDQIEYMRNLGFKPVLFVDPELLRKSGNAEELKALIEGAEELSVPVFRDSDDAVLKKMHKAYVFRYGYLSLYTETLVRRKGGKVVSGDLKIPAAH